MDIVVTGTGSPLPDPNRAGPSTLVKASDTHIVVDVGREVVVRMAGAGSLPGFLAGPVEAAQTAARVGAKRLAPTHMVPAPTAEQDPDWVARADEHIDGDVIIDDDLTTITV